MIVHLYLDVQIVMFPLYIINQVICYIAIIAHMLKEIQYLVQYVKEIIYQVM